MIDRRSLIKSSGAVVANLVVSSRSWAAGARPVRFKELAPLPEPEVTVDVTAFGAKPGSGADATPAFRAAAAKCMELKSARLLIPAGEYDFKDEQALRDFDDLMSSRPVPSHVTSSPAVVPDCARTMEFSGMDGLHIDGQGAVLIFHGLTQFIRLRDCRNFRASGFTIDWARPLMTTGEVMKRHTGELLVKIDDQYPVRGGEPTYVFQRYDRRTGDLGDFEALVGKPLEAASGGLWRIRHPLAGLFQVGDGLVIRHTIFRPMIQPYQVSGMRLEDITFLASPGFTVVSQRCSDVTFARIKVIPKDNRPMSTLGDASHFISCRGEVRLSDCEFSRMGDDSLNIHGWYHQVIKKADRRTLITSLARSRGWLGPDHPDSGDEVELVRYASLYPYWKARVTEAVYDPTREENRLVLDRDLPWDMLSNDLALDVSQLPRLEMKNCRVYNNRARAALVQTRGATVEGCVFEKATGTAIHVNTAHGWLETGGARDVTIRGNKIMGCGFGPGTYQGASAICVGVEAPLPRPGVHRRLTIADNEIDAVGRKAIQLSCVDDVLVSGNRIRNARPAICSLAATNVKKE